jgi:hypothetical protein
VPEATQVSRVLAWSKCFSSVLTAQPPVQAFRATFLSSNLDFLSQYPNRSFLSVLLASPSTPLPSLESSTRLISPSRPPMRFGVELATSLLRGLARLFPSLPCLTAVLQLLPWDSLTESAQCFFVAHLQRYFCNVSANILSGPIWMAGITVALSRWLLATATAASAFASLSPT